MVVLKSACLSVFQIRRLLDDLSGRSFDSERCSLLRSYIYRPTFITNNDETRGHVFDNDCLSAAQQ